mmetsp:Transcript_147453/g.471503  ORF Transcript_147453/g.471503 Transcript_147453/m.471503 type:complete len:233 (-) Transcript_147453:277-975(-)
MVGLVPRIVQDHLGGNNATHTASDLAAEVAGAHGAFHAAVDLAANAAAAPADANGVAVGALLAEHVHAMEPHILLIVDDTIPNVWCRGKQLERLCSWRHGLRQPFRWRPGRGPQVPHLGRGPESVLLVPQIQIEAAAPELLGAAGLSILRQHLFQVGLAQPQGLVPLRRRAGLRGRAQFCVLRRKSASAQHGVFGVTLLRQHLFQVGLAQPQGLVPLRRKAGLRRRAQFCGL